MFFSVRRLSICSRTLALTAATSEALLLSFWQRFLMMAIWRSTWLGFALRLGSGLEFGLGLGLGLGLG